MYFLPKPSQSFIEKYIEKYNKGEQITDVLVEYWAHTEEHPQLKINPKDNTITIKPVKDSWNREEVVQLASNAFRAGHARGFSGYPMTENWTKQTLDDWIKQNL